MATREQALGFIKKIEPINQKVRMNNGQTGG
jgi:hypothetical protein